MTTPRWWRWYLSGLLAAALGWRLVTLWRLSQGPLLRLIRDDSRVYWNWATEIRAGQWLPTRPFFFGPLYPYFLAFLRTIGGDQAMPVFVFQGVMGAIAVALLADAGRRVSSPIAGAIVGIFLAGYSMSVFFENMILGESLLFLLGSVALWLMVRDQGRPAWLMGLLVALMSLGRPTFMLLLIPLAVLIWKRRPVRPLPSLAALAAAPLIAILATGFYHQRVIGAFIPLTYSGGYNLYIGNGPQATGAFQMFTDASATVSGGDTQSDALAAWDGRAYLSHSARRELGPAASSRYWRDLALDHMKSDPISAARLFLGKIALLLNHREIPQFMDARVSERVSGPLGWPLSLEFAFIAILGLAAIPLAWSRGPEARAAIGYLTLLVLGIAVFFVVDRYRIHLVPPLAVLSAMSIAALAGWKTIPRRRQLVMIAIAVAAGALAFAPLFGSTPTIDEWNDSVTLGDAWLTAGDAQKAIPWFERAAALDRSGALADTSSLPIRLARAAFYQSFAIAESRAGHDREALAALTIAVRLAPESRPLRARYAEQLVLCGELDRARDEYRAAGVSGRAAADPLLEEAARQDRLGHAKTTRDCLEVAITLDPGNEPATVALVRTHIVANELEAARDLLRAGVAAGLDANVARAHQAWIAQAAGDTAAARRMIATIPESVRVFDPRVAGTLALASARRK